MTRADLTRLKELNINYEAMVRGKPWDVDGRSWDSETYNEYIRALLTHAADLIKAANASFIDS